MDNFWTNKKVLITAGPTKEKLDPVRFITNESSGKMGYALAERLHELGADVVLISGPVQPQSTFPKDKIIYIDSAIEMLGACEKYFKSIDVAIFAAAVADYRPMIISNQKIKKNGEYLNITLQKNPDIAFEFGKVKQTNKQLSIGFALETENLLENAKNKLDKKLFDFIVMNSPNNEGEGFGYYTNKISIMTKEFEAKEFDFNLKSELAREIIDFVAVNQAIIIN